MKRKTTDRWGVMLPTECKPVAERILEQTGIESLGKMFEMMLARNADDFIQAYNAFMKRTSDSKEEATATMQPVSPQPEPEQFTPMSF